MKKLSVIVPCYNEQEVLEIFHNELVKHVKDVDCEIIFVNDGSKDKTFDVMKKLKAIDDRVVLLSFSRNFGKESAMHAGLQESTGKYIVIMDSDLQDPPHLLQEMLQILDAGEYDSVATRRVSRKGEPPIRSLFARGFYKLINKFSEVEIVDGARDYRMMTRQMVDSILEMDEYHRFSKGIFSWVGYDTHYMEFENVERAAGETSWSFWGLFKYAIEGIVAFTVAPLKLSTYIGAVTSIVALGFMLFIIIKKFIVGDPAEGYPSLITVISLLGGIQLLSLGIIGEYLGKAYMETKRRPKYFIKTKIK